MEVDGMHRDDCGEATGKAVFCYSQTCLHGELLSGRWLEIHGAVEMQKFCFAIGFKVGRHGISGPILRHLNAMLRPRMMRALIRTIAGSASRARSLREKLRKGLYRIVN